MEVVPSGPTPARILIVGEAPGAEEVRVGQPFMGASGNELTKMLGEAGINRAECRITNMVSIRPPNNHMAHFIFRKGEDKSKYVTVRGRLVNRCIQEGVEKLRLEILACQPNVIIAVGNWPMWALTGVGGWQGFSMTKKGPKGGPTGITDWRGSTLAIDLVEGFKTVLTYHPAALLRQWYLRPIAVQDFRRARREASSRALQTPPWDFTIRPGLEAVLSKLKELCEFADRLPGVVVQEQKAWGLPVPCQYVTKLKIAGDIETSYTPFVTCVAIAWSKHAALCIPFTCMDNEEGYWSEEEETLIVWWLLKLLSHSNVELIGQNWMFDAQYFFRWYHIILTPARDTMIAQHTMFPSGGAGDEGKEDDAVKKKTQTSKVKSLDFMASLYCASYAQWKHEGKEA